MGSWPRLSSALEQWGDVELRARLSGGHRNEVHLAELRGRAVVVRRSSRPAAALEWELDLLDHLAAEGVGVPRLVLTGDGRRQVDGLTVQDFVSGVPPRSRRDWDCVADTLRAVHANIGLAGGHAVLLDWDEARVDVAWFDLAFLPAAIVLPDVLDRRDVETAGIAWETATCWTAEPGYARTRAEALARRQERRGG